MKNTKRKIYSSLLLDCELTQADKLFTETLNIETYEHLRKNFPCDMFEAENERMNKNKK